MWHGLRLALATPGLECAIKRGDHVDHWGAVRGRRRGGAGELQPRREVAATRNVLFPTVPQTQESAELGAPVAPRDSCTTDVA
jgi:hypothetical protein